MGGQFIKLGPSSPDCIGLMEIRRFSVGVCGGQTRRDSLLAEKVSWLSVWYSLQKRGLTEEDRSYIDSSLIECYGRFGITFDNTSLFEEDGKTLKEMPVVKDWYDLLMERPETRHLAVVLTRYVTGSAASMGGRTKEILVAALDGQMSGLLLDHFPKEAPVRPLCVNSKVLSVAFGGECVLGDPWSDAPLNWKGGLVHV